MTPLPDPARRHYVYILVRWKQPFYVGLGFASRWKAHWYVKDGNRHKAAIIRQLVEAGIPKEECVIFAQRNLTREQGGLLENALIRAIGRTPDGPLVNLSAGGEGSSYGYKWSPEQVANLPRTRWSTDGIINRRISFDAVLPGGWRWGRKFTKDHTANLQAAGTTFASRTHRARAHMALGITLANKPPQLWITNGAQNRKISSTSSAPAGWTLGHTLSVEGRVANATAASVLLSDGEASRRGKSAWDRPASRAALMASRQDQCWITDGVGNRRQSKSEAIPEGWRRGRIGLYGRAAAKAVHNTESRGVH